MGRLRKPKPSGLASLEERFADAQKMIERYVPVSRACSLVGIPRSTYYWMLKEKGGRRSSHRTAPECNQRDDIASDNPAVEDTEAQRPEAEESALTERKHAYH